MGKEVLCKVYIEGYCQEVYTDGEDAQLPEGRYSVGELEKILFLLKLKNWKSEP